MINEGVSISKGYPYEKCQIIEDVFGGRFYVKEVLFDAKFKLKIYSGRPICNTCGRNQFIVTPELRRFILSTLKVPNREFTSTLKKSMVIALRRTLQDNPFGSYVKWVESKRRNKPLFITLNNAKRNPEIFVDFSGGRYVLLSASITKDGVILPMGVKEHLFLNKDIKNTKEYILTSEIALILKKDRFYPHRLLKRFPFTEQTLCTLRKKLGYDTYTDRNTWLALHINEILVSTATAFCLKHKKVGIKKNVIFDIKLSAKSILNDINNSSDSYLMEILLTYWKTPSDTARKTVDSLLGKYKSKKYRRIFAILKEANKL